jgi:ribose transport system ATP-binding protein
VRGLTKSFAGQPALLDVDLDIEPGTVHALLGENGSGKSTLIKILSGYHVPDEGSQIRVGGLPLVFGAPGSAHDLGCRFVHQDLGLIDSCSVADNMGLTAGFPTTWGAVRGKELRRRARAALARLGLDLDPDVLMGSLPPAVRTGIAVARALGDGDISAVRLLVLDEPTATLPDSEVRHLLDVVRAVAGTGVGVLYVTHHLDEVFQIAQEVSVLRDGRKVVTAATTTLTRQDIVTYLVGQELDEVRAATNAMHATLGPPALAVEELTAGPLRSVSFSIRRGEIVGLAGVTGSGRETVLPATFGGVPREHGTVTLSGRVVDPHRPRSAIAAGMAMLPADRVRHSGILALPARENLTLPQLAPHWRAPFLRRADESEESRTWFAKLDVRPGRAIDAPLSSFSGGNQQKVLFAKWLRCTPRVLLLDEPTQGVDIGARAEIHRQVIAAVEAGAAALVSSSDYDELVALCHRVLVLRAGKIVAELQGPELTVANVARESLGTDKAVA